MLCDTIACNQKNNWKSNIDQIIYRVSSILPYSQNLQKNILTNIRKELSKLIVSFLEFLEQNRENFSEISFCVDEISEYFNEKNIF